MNGVIINIIVNNFAQRAQRKQNQSKAEVAVDQSAFAKRPKLK